MHRLSNLSAHDFFSPASTLHSSSSCCMYPLHFCLSRIYALYAHMKQAASLILCTCSCYLLHTTCPFHSLRSAFIPRACCSFTAIVPSIHYNICIISMPFIRSIFDPRFCLILALQAQVLYMFLCTGHSQLCTHYFFTLQELLSPIWILES